jgi:hypothetical protein
VQSSRKSLVGETWRRNSELEGAGLYVEERELAVFSSRDGSVWGRRFAGEFDFRPGDGGSGLVNHGAADES